MQSASKLAPANSTLCGAKPQTHQKIGSTGNIEETKTCDNCRQKKKNIAAVCFCVDCNMKLCADHEKAGKAEHGKTTQ